MSRANIDRAKIEAIAIDPLTALIDSWSSWMGVAGEPALGIAGRNISLRRVTAPASIVDAPELIVSPGYLAGAGVYRVGLEARPKLVI